MNHFNGDVPFGIGRECLKNQDKRRKLHKKQKNSKKGIDEIRIL